VTRSDLRHLETARLSCEALVPAHADEIAPLLWDPRVAATLSPDEMPPAWGAAPDELAVNDLHWRTHGFGLWLLRDRGTGQMVGRGGLQHTDATGDDEVEIAWAIAPERWRQGLATELALVCMSVAFEQLELGSVIAYTRPDNIASRRVMEKAGLVLERTFPAASGRDQVLYRRHRWYACAGSYL
jgi:RimJ/RimL family protein N-acetyltransferase